MEKQLSAVSSQPLAIDLCCGLGGWTRGLMEVGFHVIGFDIEYFAEYPGQLVIQDVRTVSGSRFRHASLIVASPPCQEFSRHDQPWTRRYNPPPPDLSIVQACWRIAAEAGVPIVMENVRGAQKFIGRASIHYGSQYLWGDIPALLPIHRRTTRKNFYWWGKPGDRQADIPQKRNKESKSSRAVAERSLIPIELAKHVGRVFFPRGTLKETQCATFLSAPTTS
jgi:hypothetical protein